MSKDFQRILCNSKSLCIASLLRSALMVRTSQREAKTVKARAFFDIWPQHNSIQSRLFYPSWKYLLFVLCVVFNVDLTSKDDITSQALIKFLNLKRTLAKMLSMYCGPQCFYRFKKPLTCSICKTIGGPKYIQRVIAI